MWAKATHAAPNPNSEWSSVTGSAKHLASTAGLAAAFEEMACGETASWEIAAWRRAA